MSYLHDALQGNQVGMMMCKYCLTLQGSLQTKQKQKQVGRQVDHPRLKAFAGFRLALIVICLMHSS